MKKSKKAIKFCYLAKLSVGKGLSFIESPKSRIFGFKVVYDKDRFNILRSCALKCYNCGAKATHCLIEHHRNDITYSNLFRLNFYSDSKMMTWDHIVPASYGGSDNPANARIACEKCNGDRGNDMSLKELLWTLKQDPLLLYKNKRQAPASLKRLVKGAILIANGAPNPEGLKLTHFKSLIDV